MPLRDVKAVGVCNHQVSNIWPGRKIGACREAIEAAWVDHNNLNDIKGSRQTTTAEIKGYRWIDNEKHTDGKCLS